MVQHASSCFVLLALAATAPAQTLPTFALRATVPWHTTAFGPPGMVLRCVSGELNGDGRADCFALAGTSGTDIVFCSGPGDAAGSVKLAQHANDIAIAHGDGPNGRDALVAVDGDGLRKIWFDATKSPPFDHTMLSNDDLWRNASVLRCDNINGTGGLDYVAVDDTRHSVIYRRDAAGGTVESSFNVTPTVLDVEPLHWGPGSLQSLALLTSTGVEIRAADTGALIDTFSTPSGVAIAVMRVGANGPDRLLFVVRVTEGMDVLQVLRRQGPKLEAILALPRDDTHAIVTGDVDGDVDGDQDLVLSFMSTTSLLYLTNLGLGSGVFAISETTSAWISEPVLTDAMPGAHAAAPLLRDFDNDGCLDLFLAETDAAQVATSFRVYGQTPEGSPLTSEEFFQGSPSPEIRLMSGSYRVEVSMAFDAIPDGDIHLEVSVWNSPDAITLNKIGLDRYLEPISEVGLTMTAGNVDVHTDHACFTGAKFVEVRLVELDNGTIVKAWPTYTFALAWGPSAYTLVGNYSDLHFPVLLDGSTVCPPIGSWPCSVIPRKRKLDPPPGSIVQPAPVNTTSPMTVSPTTPP